MNRQDRNELKEYLSKRIQERINQIRSTSSQQTTVTPLVLAKYAESLGVGFLWGEYVSAAKAYLEAQTKLNTVKEDLNNALPKEKRGYYRNDIETTFNNGAQNMLDVQFNETPEGQKVQQLKKEQSNLGASLLMINLPDEVKELINRIDMLLGGDDVLA